MRTPRKVFALALISAIPLAAFAAEPAKRQESKAPVTMADFAVMLASNQGIAADAPGAAEMLTKAGVPAFAELNAPLTEARLVEVLEHLGVRARTSHPNEAVSRGRAEASLVLVSDTALGLGTAAVTPGPGLQSLEDCLAFSKNHGFCVNCCKDLNIRARSCTRICEQFTGKPSEEEPLP